MAMNESNMDPISRDQFDLVLHASNEGVWDWRVGDDAIYYSDRALEFLGYSQEAAPNLIKYASDYLYQDDLERFQTSFDDVLASGEDDILAVDCRYHHPDGSLRWLRIRGAVVRDDSGDALQMIGSLIDISRRKNIETAV